MISCLDLKRAMGVSLLAHLFVLFLFRVNMGSSGRIFSYQSYRISFLGAILDEHSLTVISSGEMKLEHPARSWFPEEVLTPVPILPPQSNFVRLPVILQSNLSEWNWNRESRVPVALHPSHPAPLFLKMDESSFVTLEGEIKQRMILYQPDLSEFLERDENIPNTFQMAFRFGVSLEGIVEQVEPTLSSGSVELDRLGMHYLRQWRFTSLDSLAKNINSTQQWGVLRIKK